MFGDLEKSIVASAMFAFHQQTSNKLEDDIQDQGKAEQDVNDAGGNERAECAGPSSWAGHGTSSVKGFCVQSKCYNGKAGAQEVDEGANVSEDTASEWDQIQQDHAANRTGNSDSQAGVLHWPTGFEIGVCAGSECLVSKSDVTALVENDGEDKHAGEKAKVDEDKNKDALASCARYTTTSRLVSEFVILCGFLE